MPPFKAVRNLFKTPREVRSKFRATYQRMTKRGEKMAWLTLADATGAIEAAVFPQAFARLADSGDGESPLREGAFLVARGRLSQEEATGSKLFVDDIVNLYPGAWLSALVISIQESSDASSATDMRAG
jgi:DNA polymerase III alpha subunit